jgi:hypothetical protein
MNQMVGRYRHMDLDGLLDYFTLYKMLRQHTTYFIAHILTTAVYRVYSA